MRYDFHNTPHALRHGFDACYIIVQTSSQRRLHVISPNWTMDEPVGIKCIATGKNPKETAIFIIN